eukprot:Amastigsp_a512209_8.p2 type:complete len:111 gc:universal Amastigsp_a512209_8:1665-1333(-)
MLRKRHQSTVLVSTLEPALFAQSGRNNSWCRQPMSFGKLMMPTNSLGPVTMKPIFFNATLILQVIFLAASQAVCWKHESIDKLLSAIESFIAVFRSKPKSRSCSLVMLQL